MNNSNHNTKQKESMAPVTEAGMQTQVLQDILQQLDSLKKSVDQLSEGMKQAPEVLEMATDAIDNLAIKARAKGIDIEARGEKALHLMERISAPETLNKLELLLDLSDQLPDFVTDVFNVVDQNMEAAHKNGIDVMQRSKDMLHILNRVSSPKMMAQINALLDFAEQGTDMMGLGADLLDDSMIKLQKQGIDIYKAAENGQKILLAANTALHETLDESPKKIGGLFGLLRQLNDKDFQKVLAFLTTFGKHFGKELGK